MTKQAIGIQRLLEWAYRDELPRARRFEPILPQHPDAPKGGWDAVARQGELMVETIDDGTRLNRWGVVPEEIVSRDPHPDAIAVGLAVQALDRWLINLPDTWAMDPLLSAGIAVEGEGDMTREEWAAAAERALARLTLKDADGRTTMRRPISHLVIRAATMRKALSVSGARIKRRFVLAANGKPAWFARDLAPVGFNADGSQRMGEVEVNGVQRNGRLKPGAYRKYEVDPDPALVLLERAEYEVWRAALDVLAEDLDGKLEAHTVRPSRLPWRPWAEPASALPTVLPDLTPPITIEAREQPVAGPPLGRWGRPKREAARKIKSEAYLHQPVDMDAA